MRDGTCSHALNGSYFTIFLPQPIQIRMCLVGGRGAGTVFGWITSCLWHLTRKIWSSSKWDQLAFKSKPWPIVYCLTMHYSKEALPSDDKAWSISVEFFDRIRKWDFLLDVFIVKRKAYSPLAKPKVLTYWKKTRLLLRLCTALGSNCVITVHSLALCT